MSLSVESSKVRVEALPAKAMRLGGVVAMFHILEFLFVLGAAYISSIVYHNATLQSHLDIREYLSAAIYIAILTSIVSAGFRHFAEVQRQPLHVLLWNGLGSVSLAFSFLLSTLFIVKISESYSRGTLAFQIIAVTAVICISRTMFYFWLQTAVRAGQIEARHVVLIGDERYRLQFADMVKTAGIRSIGSLPFPHHQEAKGGIDNYQLVNNKAARETIEFCRSVHPDDIVILTSQEELAAAPELARRLSELPVNVHIVPLGSVNFFGTSRIAELGDLKTLQVSRPPLSLFDRAMKRAFDVAAAFVGIILFAPLFAIVAIAIKLESRGPIFFRQERHGYNNTIIHVLKFRSMISAEEGECFVQATRTDKRVTHIGRIIRRTNIDELAQLFNVLVGDMSIVGPRPHATAHNEMFEDRILPFSRRHNIKPGITGWAQVNGHRGETDTLEKMQRRVEHDLYYIDNWSFLLDLKIILLTFFSKRAYTNAY
jgi:Undecaprenyl-phosphate glucose phosphotransferase